MILQAVPRSGGGYGGILLLCLIILVIYIVIKLIRKTPHKQPISKHLSNEEKPVKNNLYRADNNVKLCKQDNLKIEAFHIDDCINNKAREVSELDQTILKKKFFIYLFCLVLFIVPSFVCGYITLEKLISHSFDLDVVYIWDSFAIFVLCGVVSIYFVRRLLKINQLKGKKVKCSETHKMIREDNSTKSTTTSSDTKCKKGICKPLIWVLSVLITLYALLWVLGYASIARYDGICGYYDSLYCGISKNGNIGLAKRIYILGIEFYKEIYPCEYKSCTLVSMQPQKQPWSHSPSDRVVLVRDFNDKLAVASACGSLYTDFIYDVVGFDDNESFWATFNRNSDGYESQIDGFFVAPALENKKWRLIDNNGTPLTSAIYDEIEPPYNGLNLRVRIGRKWSTLDVSELYLIKLNGGFNLSTGAATNEKDTNLSKSNSEVDENNNVASVKISNYIKSGTTWKCTSKSIRGYDVKSYFVFLSNNKVLWLLETPNGNTFPVGLGIYRHENNICKLSYMASDPIHQEISMYYGDNDIDFHITIDNNTNISILSKSNNPFLFDEKAYILKKHKIHFKPSSSLVNQTWGVDIGEKPCITFKNEYEALIEDDGYTSKVLYFSFDNEQGGYIAIKSGDNLSDENLIGTWRTGYRKIYNSDLMKEIESYFSEMRIHREGLDGTSNQEVVFIDCTIN